MARGTTLGQLLADLRVEANMDPNPALSQNVAPKMRLRLMREQERLYDEFDWPFLRIKPTLTMAAGQRYYDVPDGMNLERIERIDCQFSGKWFPLDRGIAVEQYNTYDSDADVRVDPAYRWDVSDTGDGPQLEIWPVPASNGNLVRVTGIRKVAQLLNDDDRADLDDQLITMFVAAEMLTDAAAAGEKRAKATRRFQTLKGLAVHTKSNSFNINSPLDDRRKPRTPLVAYVRTP